MIHRGPTISSVPFLVLLWFVRGVEIVDNPRMGSGSTHNAVALLRNFRVGVLLADEVPWPAPFVIDGRLGRVVIPVTRDVVDAEQLVMFVPEERDDAMQLLLDAHEIEPDSACDRYLAYHGRAPHPHWIAATIDAVRWADSILDGDEFDLRNVLHDAEPALLRVLNADRASLALVCDQSVSVEPVAVGIDPYGIDVRTRPGLVRVRFDSSVESADDALLRVTELLRRSES